MSEQPHTTTDAVLRELGYGLPHAVEGRSSIADLFPAARRCGVYVLEFTNGEVYGGQAVDVTRRYVQHIKTHTDVRRISFQLVPKEGLNGFERNLIRTLEQRGLRTRNITFASAIIGERDFDLVMPADEQARFGNDLSFNDSGGARTRDDELRRKLAGRYDAFAARPHAQTVLRLLRDYVPKCIPSFRHAELSFWSLSVPPKPAYVYARANVGWQEVLTAYEREDDSLWFSFHVSKSPLDSPDGNERLLSAFPGAEISDHNYAPGGSDQINVTVPARTAPALLSNEAFLRAARLMNLRLMRKGPCPSAKWHCFALADAVIPDSLP